MSYFDLTLQQHPLNPHYLRYHLYLKLHLLLQLRFDRHYLLNLMFLKCHLLLKNLKDH